MKTTVWLGMAVLAVAVPGEALAKKDPGRLPPGLQKKVERGGELPPGWRKKLREGDTLGVRFYRAGRVEPVNARYEKVHVEDKVYTVIKNTREIVDILSE